MVKNEKVLHQTLATRLFHWTLFFTTIFLIISGFYITYPFIQGLPMRTIKTIHATSAFIFMSNLAGYTYYYIFSKQWYHIILSWRDLREFPGFLSYVFFLRKEHPFYGKYNPGQKLIYTSWFLTGLGLSVTGLALKFKGPMLALFTPYLNISSLRLLHYYLAVYFAATIPIHIYLALTENPVKLQAIFSGYLRRK
ncbi:MAG: Di-heme cytochrome, transrane [Peptococcaceae bacterium]|jgi:Ni/Fe-hydrogenase 1 B-type cytochrome subunit|nr:Di-heme cytochrome, transrane [Peptococcaceae bacterium]